MTDPLVVVATITASRRVFEHSGGIPHKLDYERMLYYVNYEEAPGEPFEIGFEAGPILSACDNWYGSRYHLDVWTRRFSSWWKPPQYDQDQARLAPICIARNMARDFAMSQQADWLLFLDSDVKPPPDLIQKLLAAAVYNNHVRRWVVGGLVPGRGVHTAGYYFFWPKSNTTMHPASPPWATEEEMDKGIPLQECQHATMGCVMIHKTVFNWLPFTWVGDTCERYIDPAGVMPGALSEDPAFGIMAPQMFGDRGRWTVRTDVFCEHLGPLEAAEVAQF